MDPITLTDTSSTGPHASTSRTVHPKVSMEDGGVDESFDNYCIVCDRLIIPPKEPENVTKTTKKKAAGGAIRVKNPDGSTTTRTANGTKITRPGLKRNTSSVNRLAQVAAANSNAVKLHPLTRSKTAEPVPTHSTTTESSTAVSPKSNASPEPPCKSFSSSIYCSKGCCEEDAGRSSEAYRHLSRTFSNDFALPHPPFASEHGVYVADPNADPNAPPSPLFISGSDTDSSNAGGLEGPACSAPKTLEYFRISRGGPDDAWRDHQRQRRSSMHQSMAPAPMTRQLSSHSSVHRGYGGMSSDSLSSLWNLPATEADLDNLTRVTSSGGQERIFQAGGRKSMSSDRSVPIPPRLPRSGMSQTSLVSGSSPASIPQDQTLSLLQSYATHFPARDATSASSYSSNKGYLPSMGSRRQSLCMTPQTRPDMATLRTRRSESGALTWDEFGLSEVEANNARARARRSADSAGAPFVGGLSVPQGFTDGSDITPKQSLEVENGKWKVKYALSSHGTIKQRKRVEHSPTMSHTSSSSSEGEDARPKVVTSKSFHLSPQVAQRPNFPRSKSHTGEQEMPPPTLIPNRSSTGLVRLDSPNPDSTPRAIAPTPRPYAEHASSVPSKVYMHSRGSHPALPNLAALRLNSTGGTRCAPLPGAGEYVKSGFSWAEHEAKGGKMYELPSGMKIDRNKAGLFYFN